MQQFIKWHKQIIAQISDRGPTTLHEQQPQAEWIIRPVPHNCLHEWQKKALTYCQCSASSGLYMTQKCAFVPCPWQRECGDTPINGSHTFSVICICRDYETELYALAKRLDYFNVETNNKLLRTALTHKSWIIGSPSEVFEQTKDVATSTEVLDEPEQYNDRLTLLGMCKA